MDKTSLINQITPLYNRYKTGKDKISGTEALLIMWDIGESLKRYLQNNKIKPHTLYRDIYGKSEGQTNIAQKSYITREFLGRCFRIREMFKNKEEIKQDLPSLNSFTNFREAMPFFDNPQYKLSGHDKDNLLKLLNSRTKPTEVLNQIRMMQKAKIGKSNPRTQRLGDLESEKDIFIKFYNYIFGFIKANDYAVVKKESLDNEFLKTLSKDLSALAQDGMKLYPIEIYQRDAIWEGFTTVIKKLVEEKDPKNIRRFRRLVPPERMVRLSDMVYALTNQELYNKIQTK